MSLQKRLRFEKTQNEFWRWLNELTTRISEIYSLNEWKCYHLCSVWMSSDHKTYIFWEKVLHKDSTNISCIPICFYFFLYCNDSTWQLLSYIFQWFYMTITFIYIPICFACVLTQSSDALIKLVLLCCLIIQKNIHLSWIILFVVLSLMLFFLITHYNEPSIWRKVWILILEFLHFTMKSHLSHWFKFIDMFWN